MLPCSRYMCSTAFLPISFFVFWQHPSYPLIMPANRRFLSCRVFGGNNDKRGWCIQLLFWNQNLSHGSLMAKMSTQHTASGSFIPLKPPLRQKASCGTSAFIQYLQGLKQSFINNTFIFNTQNHLRVFCHIQNDHQIRQKR